LKVLSVEVVLRFRVESTAIYALRDHIIRPFVPTTINNIHHQHPQQQQYPGLPEGV
jgi:hypothetical protein